MLSFWVQIRQSAASTNAQFAGLLFGCVSVPDRDTMPLKIQKTFVILDDNTVELTLIFISNEHVW